MKRNAALFVFAGAALALAMSFGCVRLTRHLGDGMVHVVFETEKGPIEMALDTKRAPITTAGFLRYVDAGFYTNGTFFRTTSRPPGSTRGIVIIQAEIEAQHHAMDLFPSFALETTSQTLIRHTDGTLSMPRWDEPNSATSGVSIMIGDNHGLNAGSSTRNPRGYAAFGHVVRGMDVVKAIHDSPARGENLTPPIKILKAYRTPAPQE